MAPAAIVQDSDGEDEAEIVDVVHQGVSRFFPETSDTARPNQLSTIAPEMNDQVTQPDCDDESKMLNDISSEHGNHTITAETVPYADMEHNAHEGDSHQNVEIVYGKPQSTGIFGQSSPRSKSSAPRRSDKKSETRPLSLPPNHVFTSEPAPKASGLDASYDLDPEADELAADLSAIRRTGRQTVPVVIIDSAGPKKRKRRNDDDELALEVSLPEEMYKPRPSRSRGKCNTEAMIIAEDKPDETAPPKSTIVPDDASPSAAVSRSRVRAESSPRSKSRIIADKVDMPSMPSKYKHSKKSQAKTRSPPDAIAHQAEETKIAEIDTTHSVKDLSATTVEEVEANLGQDDSDSSPPEAKVKSKRSETQSRGRKRKRSSSVRAKASAAPEITIAEAPAVAGSEQLPAEEHTFACLQPSTPSKMNVIVSAATPPEMVKDENAKGPDKHSPLSAKRLYRVGLSKRARIAPLLRIVRK